MLSYILPAVTPAEATAYHAATGATGWPELVAAREQALMRGQRYIAGRFNARWADEWTEPPEAVRQAICEAALIEARDPGSLSPVSVADQAKVLVEVKGIAWERVKAPTGEDSYIPRIAAVDGLLRGLVTGGATRLVVRA